MGIDKEPHGTWSVQPFATETTLASAEFTWGIRRDCTQNHKNTQTKLRRCFMRVDRCGPRAAGWTHLCLSWRCPCPMWPVGPEDLFGVAPGPIPCLLSASVSQVVQEGEPTL